MVAPNPSGERLAPSPAPVEPAWLARLRRAARIDLSPGPRQPSGLLVIVAAVLAAAVCLTVDQVAVHVATSHFATTRHFSHFRFVDYAPLTVVGVALASAAWPAVTRVSSAPRWLFFRLAVLVTLALWLPDVALLLGGETVPGVGVLMALHLLIAVVTYNALVHVARVPGGGRRRRRDAQAPQPALRPMVLSERLVRRIWSSMSILVAAELALGVVTIVSVPFRRPNALLPPRGTLVYSAHAGVGIALGIGAIGVFLLSYVGGRMARIGAVMGAAGVGIGFVGGICASFLSTRLLGMGLMLVGTVVAGVGYMAPSLEAIGKAEAARAEAARREAAASEAARREAARVRDELARLGQGFPEDAGPRKNGSSTNGHGVKPAVD